MAYVVSQPPFSYTADANIHRHVNFDIHMVIFIWELHNLSPPLVAQYALALLQCQSSSSSRVRASDQS